MRKWLAIARREYLAAVRTRSFLIGVVLIPLLMIAGGTVPALLMGREATDDKRVAVLDRSAKSRVAEALQTEALRRDRRGILDPRTGLQVLPRYLIERIAPAAGEKALSLQRVELSNRVRSGELLGFIEIEPGVYDRPGQPATAPARQDGISFGSDPDSAIRYYSIRHAYFPFVQWAGHVINQAVQSQRMIAAGLDPKVIDPMLRGVSIQARGLARQDSRTGRIIDAPAENRLMGFFVPFALAMMIFMLTVLGATPMVQGVVEEKMQRIAEVLLASVSPTTLMTGKLLGMVGVSLTMGVAYLIPLFFIGAYLGMAEYVSAGLAIWFAVFLVCSVLMFGSLSIAIGSACTSTKETQTLLMPLMLLASLPVFVLPAVIQNPGGRLATILSIVPPTAPAIMISRIAVPPGVPWWSAPAAMASVLLGAATCVWLAGRIFRVGILMQGKGASLTDLWRWIWRG